MPIQKGPANLGTGVIDATELASGSVTTAKLATTLTVTHALGSASTPSITFTGDTNTGIFSPTADTIAFAEGGAEIARFDSSGNLGIGTSSPAAKTEISGTAAANNLALRITNTATDGYSTLQLGGSGDGGLFRNGSTQTLYGGASSLNLITVGAHPIGFATGNTIRAIIPAAGGVQAVTCVSVGNATPATSGAGITFPATQSASSNANTLDDYEEGNWTPTDASGASLSFSVSGASYTKIGRTVFLTMYITYPTTSNSTPASIGGLPFTAGSDPSNIYGYLMGRTQANIGNMITWQVGGGGSTLICNYGWNSVAQPLNSTLSGSFVLVSGSYITNT
jgi:hypothetical protein